jgi:hypothetical protein
MSENRGQPNGQSNLETIGGRMIAAQTDSRSDFFALLGAVRGLRMLLLQYLSQLVDSFTEAETHGN